MIDQLRRALVARAGGDTVLDPAVERLLAELVALAPDIPPMRMFRVWSEEDEYFDTVWLAVSEAEARRMGWAEFLLYRPDSEWEGYHLSMDELQVAVIEDFIQSADESGLNMV